MNKPVKLPEIRKEAFSKARESLGLSTKDLSVKACLSVRQIEQIEKGESSSFYSAQVKFTAAKKVAGLLKLTPEEAFDYPSVAQPTKVVEVEEKLQETTKISVAEKKPKTVKEKEVQAPTKVKVDESNPQAVSPDEISQTTIHQVAKSKAAVDSKKRIFILLVIGAAAVLFVVNLRPLFFPKPVKEEAVIVQEVVPEPAPASEPAPAADAKPATVPTPTPVSEPTPAAAVAVSPECPPADATVFNYKPDAPKKAGDIVYLQSKTAQTVCVVDAAGKTQNKTLEPGVGVSVHGRPPLKVLTSGLNQLDLFYQGVKVRIGNTSAKTINLEPAEIIQPVAPASSSDSQLR